MPERCEVYWGTHGCRYDRGHEGPHECRCGFDAKGERFAYRQHDKNGPYLITGLPPYYGSHTRFYGADAEALGLALVSTDA